MAMSKRPRTLDSFFSPPPKKTRTIDSRDDVAKKDDTSNCIIQQSNHQTYPFAIPFLPSDINEMLNFAPASEGRVINDQPDLDLIYYQPYIPKEAQKDLFEFLRQELFFYRVKYTIKRGNVETLINTPRFTTVYGLDETARFDSSGAIVDSNTEKAVTKGTYKCQPRPLPQCLDHLRTLTENATSQKFNFALVNYYASGNDSISYHSDDERFLGPDPAIASFTLGAKRDFLMKHKPTSSDYISEKQPMKLQLASGDMILMKGRTQSQWLHSIPKRKTGEADKGRINITFRRAMVKGGTENYYRYNVGDGEVFRWNANRREMTPWRGEK
ncbi:Hypothetical protein R9X50_00077600 [Acrodontium crateriforme]|uniref:Fe2OG dioxygenase domain-containing protein n=1 Tax=Acrodontium crateriforme TaxID=150365 RepID=A0AAQ3LXX8_9PEZI|nr:Hypothetical protein R9X50_00077600 [Acrodontium crateriforme]